MLGIPVTKLYRICDFFDSDPDDAWDLIEAEFFEYEPGQARKRRFYEEGVMAIATYLEETEGGSFLAKLKEFFTQHRARVTRALVQRRIIQVTQDRSALVISSGLHRNFHKWVGNRLCEPKDFVDYLLRNELTHFEGSPSTRVRQEQRQQKLIHRLEMLQARYEVNRLLY